MSRIMLSAGGFQQHQQQQQQASLHAYPGVFDVSGALASPVVYRPLPVPGPPALSAAGPAPAPPPAPPTAPALQQLPSSFLSGTAHHLPHRSHTQAHHSHHALPTHYHNPLNPLLDHRPAPPPPPPPSTQHQQQPPRMASDAGPADFTMPSEEEYAHLQKLSNDFEPEVSGPLVSERQSTARITSEYANGDPVYRVKTAALQQKYSEYRTCRGDGHCGWRAIAFCYFEALQRLGDKNKFLEEETRLTSMKNVLNSVGFQEDLYEDFAEETFELLRSTGAALPASDNGAALLAAFNDQGVAMAIITHLKLITSAWIQTHPNDFAPFVPGQDLKQYCSTEIEPSVCELDNVGLNALVEALIKPAGLALEVMYLDRSQGEEMNSYRYEPDSVLIQNVPVVPTIRLLYRPGHYDILYKMEDFAPPIVAPTPMSSNVYIGLAGSAAEYLPQEIPTTRGIPELLTMIPGVMPSGFGFSQPQWSSPFEFTPPSPFPALPMAPLNYTPVQQPQPPSTTQSPQEYSAPPQDFPTAPAREFVQQQTQHQRDFPAPPQEFPRANPSIPLESPISVPISRALTIQRGEPFRPSAYELEPYFGASQPHHMPCQTSIFRNSHFNTAHYMNPDFQPEEWTPDQDYGPSHRSRNKSASQ